MLQEAESRLGMFVGFGRLLRTGVERCGAGWLGVSFGS